MAELTGSTPGLGGSLTERMWHHQTGIGGERFQLSEASTFNSIQIWTHRNATEG